MSTSFSILQDKDRKTDVTTDTYAPWHTRFHHAPQTTFRLSYSDLHCQSIAYFQIVYYSFLVHPLDHHLLLEDLALYMY